MKKIFSGVLLAVTILFAQFFYTNAACVSIGSGVKLTGGVDQTGNFTKAKSDGNKVDIDNLEVSLVDGPGLRMKLPEEVSKTLTAINSGKVNLNEVVKGGELTEYNPLVKTSTLVMKDTITQTEKQTDVVLNFYVPNLIEGTSDIKVLYYDNATGKWNVLVPQKIDYANKQLTVKISGSGTFTIIYKI